MKVTTMDNTHKNAKKVAFILCIVAAKLKGSGCKIEEMVEAIRIDFQEENVHLKIVMKASRLRAQDKLEITIRWGVFPDDPQFRKIIAHAKRTSDNLSDMLFQFEIPSAVDLDEQPTIARYIYEGMIDALKFQIRFLDMEKRWLIESIEKFKKDEKSIAEIINEYAK